MTTGLAAGLAQEELDQGIVGTPARQELARPADSTTAMAAAVAPALRSALCHCGDGTAAAQLLSCDLPKHNVQTHPSVGFAMMIGYG